MSRIRFLVSAWLLVLPTRTALAQPQPQPLVYSIGQPPRWQPYVGAGVAWDRTPAGASATVVGGVQRALLNPVAGLLAGAAEMYASPGGTYEGGGVRGMARSPMLALGLGADVNVGKGRAPRMDFILSWQSAIQRGGVLGRGTMMRVDWLPGRQQSLGVGLSMPLRQPLAGVTRPASTSARLPSAGRNDFWMTGPLPPAADSALRVVADAAARLRLFSSLRGGGEARALAGMPFTATVTRYHDALAAVFAATSGADGEPIARRARAIALEQVLIPYDSLFGIVKTDPTDIRGLTAEAQRRFARWLIDSSGVSPGTRAATLIAHARWLSLIERIQRDQLASWRDSRVVWLPLSLALRPADHDEQMEVDSLIGRLVGRNFTDENALTYLRSSDLPLEIARSVYAARDYHVLWTHDYTGQRDQTKTVDNVGFEMTADVYLPALTAAVKRYDETGTLPVYMIVLDQVFYEMRNGRLFMSILEDPLNATMELPGESAQRESHLRLRQAELRAAVAASARLQRDAAASGGAAWLRKIVKVHVNITQPSDLSFRTHRAILALPFTPDNIMRDHRKLVLYDITESEPYRGAMFLMGIGIGEHYASSTWEDRGLRLRGPAALEAREALRRLLRRNGFADHQIPVPLRAVENKDAAERRMNTGDFRGRALQVHNEPGFGRKQSSVVRAALYDLAQPGSVIVVPDPLWLSAEWGAMLAGAAARGAQVQIIAPASANAPSPQAPVLALAHQTLGNLIQLRGEMAEVLRESNGALRIGLFAARAVVDDAAGRRREVREGLQRSPWIRQLFPFDARTLAVLDRAEAQAADGRDATTMARDEAPRPPQLHQKTQLIARPGAIAVLVGLPGWEDALAAAITSQSQQTARFAEQMNYQAPATEPGGTLRTDTMLQAFEAALPESERKNVSFYFSVGTHNQDPRGIVSDGEASLVTSGFQGVTGLVDLYFLMARTTWIETHAELDSLLPPPSGFMRWLANFVRMAL